MNIQCYEFRLGLLVYGKKHKLEEVTQGRTRLRGCKRWQSWQEKAHLKSQMKWKVAGRDESLH